jgi:hypothetical protein
MTTSPEAKSLLEQHHAELARAAAAAMQQHYQETIDICSELLTSELYQQLTAADPETARACKAETRLMMATAMHYNEAHYEDVLRVLKSAADAPDSIKKDVLFTTAVLHASFNKKEEARTTMAEALSLIRSLRGSHAADREALDMQESEAESFLKQLEKKPKRK